MCFGFIGASGVAAMEIAVAVVAIRVGGALAPAAVFMALSCALRAAMAAIAAGDRSDPMSCRTGREGPNLPLARVWLACQAAC